MSDRLEPDDPLHAYFARADEDETTLDLDAALLEHEARIAGLPVAATSALTTGKAIVLTLLVSGLVAAGVATLRANPGSGTDAPVASLAPDPPQTVTTEPPVDVRPPAGARPRGSLADPDPEPREPPPPIVPELREPPPPPESEPLPRPRAGETGAAKPTPSAATESSTTASEPNRGLAHEDIAPQPDTSAVDSPETLRAEMKAVAAARRALDAGRAGEALSRLHELAAELPEGVLMEEREGLEAIALGALGRDASARKAARAFLQRYPRSPLRPQVEAVLEEN